MQTNLSEKEKTQTLSKRARRSILMTVLAILAVMVSVFFWISYQEMKAEAYARYTGIKNVSSEKVSRIIRGAEMNANNIFDDVSDSLDEPEEVISVLKAKVNLNLDVRGYFAAFTPNYYPEKGTWFEPYIYQSEFGGFEFRQVGSARHNYTKSAWYIRAKESAGSFWSDPYYYYDGTSMSGHYCTFVRPIFDAKGNLACVCGADMKFEWLSKELQWVDESSKSNKMTNKYQLLTDFDYYTVIFSNDGTCIAHPDEKTVSITDKKVLKDLTQKKSGVADFSIDGVPCTLYYGPIEFIDWTVAVVVPKHDFLIPMLPIAAILLSMLVIGMITVRFVCARL